VPEDLPYFRDVDQALLKYPYDPRRAEELMNQAGYVKDNAGFFANAGDRFRIEFRAIAGPEFERGQAILMESWRRTGIDVSGAILPANLVRDRELMHVFPGMATRGGGTLERTFTSAEFGSAANRWVGDNRSGWSSPEYDRLFAAFNNTLDSRERTGQEVQMLRILSEQLPHFVLYSAIQVNTRVPSLQGPEAGTPGFGSLTPGTHPYWNIQDWYFN
jgi:peptide/nickel transport system substrate-binding protein